MNFVGVFHFKRLSDLSTKLCGIGIHSPTLHRSTRDAHPCATPNIMKSLKSQLYIEHSTTASTGLATKVSIVFKTFLLICHFYQATKINIVSGELYCDRILPINLECCTKL